MKSNTHNLLIFVTKFWVYAISVCYSVRFTLPVPKLLVGQPVRSILPTCSNALILMDETKMKPSIQERKREYSVFPRKISIAESVLSQRSSEKILGTPSSFVSMHYVRPHSPTHFTRCHSILALNRFYILADARAQKEVRE